MGENSELAFCEHFQSLIFLLSIKGTPRKAQVMMESSSIGCKKCRHGNTAHRGEISVGKLKTKEDYTSYILKYQMSLIITQKLTYSCQFSCDFHKLFE